jgi:Chaperone of endosialidase
MLFNSTNGTHQYSDGTTWRNLSALPPAGTLHQTLRYDGSNWVSSNLIENTGTKIRIAVPDNIFFTSTVGIYNIGNESDFGLGVASKDKGVYIEAVKIAIDAYSSNSYALSAKTRDGGYSALFGGRMIIGKSTNSSLEGGIEFRDDVAKGSLGFIGMRGTTELAVYGYGYNNYIQRWNINTGSICYATTPTVCSDIRLKKDFRQLTHSSQKLNQLQGYQYYWKNEKSSDLQTGLIAQEVQKIFPELVKTDDEGMLSVDYVGLIPHLIEANKSLSARIEKLEAALLKQH